MNKQEAIVNTSTILNRGSSYLIETSYFDNKAHSKIIEELVQYFDNHKELIGNPLINDSQALNDHGVDIIIKYGETAKIGIQVKSHFDVSEKTFASKVKAQMTESQYHGLDKWYLLICSPLKDFKSDYTNKINHLINELSSYKTNYHIMLNPQQCTKLLTSPQMLKRDFSDIKKNYYYESVDWAKLKLEVSKSSSKLSYLDDLPVDQTQEAKTADTYLRYLGLGKTERTSVLKELKELSQLLKEIPKPTREFLFTCISRSNGQGHLGLTSHTLCKNIESYLSISANTIKDEVAILDEYKLAYLFDDDGQWYVAVNSPNQDYNILDEIKKFCLENGKDLKEIIVDLNFSRLD